MTLLIGPLTYQIVRGGFSGRGKIKVTGAQIEFSGNDNCAGTGTYHWSVSGKTLSLAVSGTRDPCPRIDVLDGQEYTKLAS